MRVHARKRHRAVLRKQVDHLRRPLGKNARAMHAGIYFEMHTRMAIDSFRRLSDLLDIVGGDDRHGDVGDDQLFQCLACGLFPPVRAWREEHQYILAPPSVAKLDCLGRISHRHAVGERQRRQDKLDTVTVAVRLDGWAELYARAKPAFEQPDVMPHRRGGNFRSSVPFHLPFLVKDDPTARKDIVNDQGRRYMERYLSIRLAAFLPESIALAT